MPDPAQSDYSRSSRTTLSADRPAPAALPGSDTLGYRPFAKHLARSLLQLAPLSDGFVVALYGPWGSGKSTLLGFFKDEVKKAPKPKDAQADKPLIIDFNPWWFSGQEDLTREFFTELGIALKPDDRLNTVRNLIADFSGALGMAAKLIPMVGEGMSVVVEEGVKKIRPRTKMIPEMKEEIGKKLKEANLRIIVVIDDLDRLTAEQIRQVFQLIKSVADFPGILYLLAFDRAIVARALSGAYGNHDGSGDAFLEKIVQAAFDLPFPSRAVLDTMMWTHLENIWQQGNALSDPCHNQKYIERVYRWGIMPLIRTPRDVVWLTNALWVTWAAVAGEVNPADFAALEALRLFAPSVFHHVRDHPYDFTGEPPKGEAANPKDEHAKPSPNWLEQLALPDRERRGISWLLAQIFPRFPLPADAMGPTVDGRVNLLRTRPETWRRECRVCHPDVLPLAFRLTLPVGFGNATDSLAGDFGHQDMLSLLPLAASDRKLASATDNKERESLIAQDCAQLTARLREWKQQTRPDGTSRAHCFLQRLQDYVLLPEDGIVPTIAESVQVPYAGIEVLLRALTTVGDELLLNETAAPDYREGRNAGIVVVVRSLFDRTARHLPVEERTNVLSRIFADGLAYQTIAYLTADVQETFDRLNRTSLQRDGIIDRKPFTPELPPLIQADQFETVRRAAADVIEAQTQLRDFESTAATTLLCDFTWAWNQIAPGGGVKAWIMRETADNVGLLRLLQIITNSDRVQSPFYQSFHFIWSYLERDGLRERLATLDASPPDDLSDKQLMFARGLLRTAER